MVGDASDERSQSDSEEDGNGLGLGAEVVLCEQQTTLSDPAKSLLAMLLRTSCRFRATATVF